MSTGAPPLATPYFLVLCTRHCPSAVREPMVPLRTQVATEYGTMELRAGFAAGVLDPLRQGLTGYICRTSGSATAASSCVMLSGTSRTAPRPLDVNNLTHMDDVAQFEGGLKVWCSRLGRQTLALHRPLRPRAQFEGTSMLCLGPTRSGLQMPNEGAKKRPWRLDIRALLNRWPTTRRGSLRKRAVERRRRRPALPAAWPPCGSVSPPALPPPAPRVPMLASCLPPLSRPRSSAPRTLWPAPPLGRQLLAEAAIRRSAPLPTNCTPPLSPLTMESPMERSASLAD